MNNIIVNIIGFCLAGGLIYVSLKNLIRDKKRFDKLKTIAKESTQKVAEQLNLDVSEAKERIAVTPEQFHNLQDILKGIVYDSPKLNPSEKSIFYNSLYQPTFQGQQDYLSHLLVASGATGSLVIKQPDSSKSEQSKTINIIKSSDNT